MIDDGRFYTQKTPRGVEVVSPAPLSQEDLEAIDAMNGGAGFRIKAMAAALQHEKHVEAQAELLRSMEAKS